jgi:hypothetical protein
MARKDGSPRSVRTGYTPMTKSGFCQFPSPSSHSFCSTPCDCDCHKVDAAKS